MIKHLQYSLKIILRHWQFSLINIIGLSLGIAASVLIFNHCYNELSYDKFHEKSSRIYMLGVDAKYSDYRFNKFTKLPSPLSSKLVKELSPVESAVRLYYDHNMEEQHIYHKNELYPIKKWIATDSSFFDIFTTRLIKGNPDSLLYKPFTTVITESLAKRIFQTTNCLGKHIQTPCGMELEITGVIENYPSSSHFDFEVLFSYSSYPNNQKRDNWSTYSVYTYLLLKKNSSIKILKEKFPHFINNHVKPNIDYSRNDSEVYYQFFLTPLRDIYLSDVFHKESEGKKAIIYILLITGILILLTACFNYVNLSIAIATNRRKEIGIRKVMGANRNDLIFQFLFESIVLTLIALFLGMLIVEYTLPFINDILNTNYAIDYLNSPFILPGLFIGSILLGYLSGLYPAYLLSSFRPTHILRNPLKSSVLFSKKFRTNLMNSLVNAQITICMLIIIGALTIYRQLSFMQEKNVNENMENVLILHFSEMLDQNHENFKTNLLKNKNISSISFTNSPPGKNFTRSMYTLKNSGALKQEWAKDVLGDYDLTKTLGLNIIKGRDFSKTKPHEKYSILVNQTFVEYMGIENPISKRIIGSSWQGARDINKYKIIGIVEDFHFASLRKKIDKLVIYPLEGMENRITFTLVKLKDRKNLAKTLNFIEKEWNKQTNHFYFNYSFLGQDLNKLYEKEKQTFDLLKLFSLIAVAISSLGVFGLILYILKRKTKEIAIRKTLGASPNNIISMLGRYFSYHIVVSTSLAWSGSYFLTTRWLEKFAYHIQPQMIDFILSFLLTNLFIIAVVLYHILRTLHLRPIEVLKNE